MATEPLPYYRWHWRDFRASRKVQRMSYIERGLYRELLDECWAVGYIPNDLAELADICGCPEQVLADAWQMLSKCFVERDGVLINEKLDSVRTETDKTRATRAAAGRAGALAKVKSLANAKQMPASAQQVPYSNSNSNSNSNSKAEEDALALEQQEIQRHVKIAKLLRSKGMTRVQSGNPVLLEWAKHGYTDGELSAAADDVIGRGKAPATITPAYLSAVLIGNREAASKVGSAKPAATQPASAPIGWGKQFPRASK
jgi:uncharacterized protein YdaU (DUF1376 family)